MTFAVKHASRHAVVPAILLFFDIILGSRAVGVCPPDLKRRRLLWESWRRQIKRGSRRIFRILFAIWQNNFPPVQRSKERLL